MTRFQNIQSTLAPDLRKLNELILSALSSPNELMNRVIATFLERKGKQIRPMLVLLAGKILGNVNERTMHGAAAVELLHNASLIHDDVVDDTVTRRGAATINGLWDNHLAVLVGDFFLSSALLQSVHTGNIRIVESISNLGRLLSIGELDEIYNARYADPSENSYFEIIYRKTASLFISCVEIGAIAAGIESDDPRYEALREYARLLGLCFQIRDDIFDYFPDTKIGKPTGNDLREGKITLPLLHALTLTGHPDHRQMAALARKELLEPAEIDLLINFAVENGGIEYARQTMQRMASEATETLCNAFPEPSPWRDDFIALISHVIDREY
ncbi:polyprenyl synthetase family protein [Muribaculaceae bacterium Isolate-013 (NCI)]|nr:polyprenyl synthetase family protein [Muribaculaceae bacterium Isolate-013 (NCI)]